MACIKTIFDLPNVPAVYALCARNTREVCCVYVGHTRTLKTRIKQHLVTCDSSINAATAAARLNPKRITEVRWWTSDAFVKDGQPELQSLKAAELIAFDLFKPLLRSNGAPDSNAQKLSNQPDFRTRMESLFQKQDPESVTRGLTAERLDLLEEMVEALKKQVQNLESNQKGGGQAANSGTEGGEMQATSR